MFTASSRVRVVADRTGTFYGQAIRAGNIDTVAGRTLRATDDFGGDGGPAVRAFLDSPEDVVVNGAGNLVITDGHNRRVRMVTG